MLGSIGLPEILIIALVFGLFFGVKRIPEFMSGLGKGIRDFKKGIRDDE